MIKNPLKFFIKLFLITLLLLILYLVIVFIIANRNNLTDIIIGYLASLLIFTLGFLSICWAIKKSIKTFMTVVMGGMFVRFILIAVLLFLLMRFTEINTTYFIITFAVFYLIYQVFEFRFINANMDKGKK